MLFVYFFAALMLCEFDQRIKPEEETGLTGREIQVGFLDTEGIVQASCANQYPWPVLTLGLPAQIFYCCSVK